MSGEKRAGSTTYSRQYESNLNNSREMAQRLVNFANNQLGEIFRSDAQAIMRREMNKVREYMNQQNARREQQAQRERLEVQLAMQNTASQVAGLRNQFQEGMRETKHMLSNLKSELRRAEENAKKERAAILDNVQENQRRIEVNRQAIARNHEAILKGVESVMGELAGMEERHRAQEQLNAYSILEDTYSKLSDIDMECMEATSAERFKEACENLKTAKKRFEEELFSAADSLAQTALGQFSEVAAAAAAYRKKLEVARERAYEQVNNARSKTLTVCSKELGDQRHMKLMEIVNQKKGNSFSIRDLAEVWSPDMLKQLERDMEALPSPAEAKTLEQCKAMEKQGRELSERSDVMLELLAKRVRQHEDRTSFVKVMAESLTLAQYVVTKPRWAEVNNPNSDVILETDTGMRVLLPIAPEEDPRTEGSPFILDFKNKKDKQGNMLKAQGVTKQLQKKGVVVNELVEATSMH